MSVVVQTFALTLALASEVEGRKVHVHARAARKVRDLAEVCSQWYLLRSVYCLAACGHCGELSSPFTTRLIPAQDRR